MRPLTHPAQPYPDLLVASVRAAGGSVGDARLRSLMTAPRPAVVHLHWPEQFLNESRAPAAWRGLAKLLLTIAICRARRLTLVWTAHNLDPHERLRPRSIALYRKLFPKVLDGVVFLTRASQEYVHEQVPALREVPSVVIRHGQVSDVYGPTPAKDEARRTLNLPPEATVLLVFGLVRNYKGIRNIIALADRAGQDGVVLLVAGKPQSAQTADLQAAADASGGALRLDLRLVPAGEVPTLFAACDAVLLPYTGGLNSGVAVLALSLGRPLVAADLPFARDLLDVAGEEWVLVLPDGVRPDALPVVRSWAQRRRTSRPDLTEWPAIGRAHLEFFASLVGETASPPPAGAERF